MVFELELSLEDQTWFQHTRTRLRLWTGAKGKGFLGSWSGNLETVWVLIIKGLPGLIRD